MIKVKLVLLALIVLATNDNIRVKLSLMRGIWEGNPTIAFTTFKGGIHLDKSNSGVSIVNSVFLGTNRYGNSTKEMPVGSVVIGQFSNGLPITYLKRDVGRWEVFYRDDEFGGNFVNDGFVQIAFKNYKGRQIA